jgi:short-subunit dehydrogenase
MQIKDRVIIITGASSGIGEALARRLSKEGAKLILVARSEEKLNLLKLELGAEVVKADMRKKEDIQKMIDTAVKKYGRVDLLVNNAGQGMYGPVERIDIEKYQDIITLNVFGPLRAMEMVIPQMRKQGGGMILNISSRVSKNYFPMLAAYASTKYALNALSLTARTELEPDKIVVSVFHPKMTATKFGENAIGERPEFTRQGGNYTVGRPDVDTAEQVADKIVEQIRSEVPEAEM